MKDDLNEFIDLTQLACARWYWYIMLCIFWYVAFSNFYVLTISCFIVLWTVGILRMWHY